MELYSWFLNITSNHEHNKILNFIFNTEKDLYLGKYIVVYDTIHLKNGKVFGDKDSYMFLLSITSFSKDPLKRLIKAEIINENNIVDLEDIKENEFKENRLKNGIYFEREVNLINHLEKIDFKFNDGSKYTEFKP